jgi:hypothetical protein
MMSQRLMVVLKWPRCQEQAVLGRILQQPGLGGIFLDEELARRLVQAFDQIRIDAIENLRGQKPEIAFASLASFEGCVESRIGSVDMRMRPFRSLPPAPLPTATGLSLARLALTM